MHRMNLKMFYFQAIMVLQGQGLFDGDSMGLIRNVVLVQLNLPFNSKSGHAAGERKFVKMSLSLLATLGDVNDKLVIELMSQIITADMEVRYA